MGLHTGVVERHATLTGIGGTGKTRLALAVARDLLDQAPGGVFLVRLAGIREPDSILAMIAEAVGIAGDAREPFESVLAQRQGARRLATSLARAGRAAPAFEVAELTRLLEEQTGRVGNLAAKELEEALALAREMAGSDVAQAAILRARKVAPARRAERALVLGSESSTQSRVVTGT